MMKFVDICLMIKFIITMPKDVWIEVFGNGNGTKKNEERK